MKEETELFFDSIMREDRSVMDLLNADYTFVNERLARHYGIPNIYGSQFRRVQVPNEARRGLLGQASILTVTSYPNRTSPVERGKWILTNLLGVPPQPPPPNVPPLQDSRRGRQAAVAARAHGAASRQSGVRRLPPGDGSDRVRAGELRRHRPLARRGRRRSRSTRPARCSPAPSWTASSACVARLAKRPEVFVGVLTEKMLTYALGRGLEYYDMPAVRKIVQDARATDYRFSSIVLGVVASVPFQMKETT